MLEKEIFYCADFQAKLASVTLGTTVTVDLPRTGPIEEVLVVVDATNGATGPTLKASPQTPAQCNPLTGILSKARLTFNAPAIPGAAATPWTQVDYDGPGLISLNALWGKNLDVATLEALRLETAGGALANNGTNSILYRIPVVNPKVTQPARTRCLLPAHIIGQSPQLALTFAPTADLYTAGSISAVAVSVFLVRRLMPDDVTAKILAAGGFIRSDLVVTPWSPGVGVSGIQNFNIPMTGKSTAMHLRQFLGGANMTRAVLDRTTTFGAESTVKVLLDKVPRMEFRSKLLRAINDWDRPLNAASQTSAPNISGGNNAADLLIDLLAHGDSSSEFGSVFDLDAPLVTGKLAQIQFDLANTATNGSVLLFGQHRLFGNLDSWQTF